MVFLCYNCLETCEPIMDSHNLSVIIMVIQINRVLYIQRFEFRFLHHLITVISLHTCIKITHMEQPLHGFSIDIWFWKIGYICCNEAFMSVKSLFSHSLILNETIKPSSFEVLMLNHSEHFKNPLHIQPIILDMMGSNVCRNAMKPGVSWCCAYFDSDWQRLPNN